jgi:beta-ribofuranosylaminobenzene 5'-phosphate synthase
MVILPRASRRLSGADEMAFFTGNTPIPRDEVLEAIASVYSGIVPAALEEDFDHFRQSLMNLQQMGFKRREIAAQSDEVRAVLGRLRNTTPYAVGLSSMGPAIFVVGNAREDAILKGVARCLEGVDAQTYGPMKARNAGFEMVVSD